MIAMATALPLDTQTLYAGLLEHLITARRHNEAVLSRPENARPQNGFGGIDTGALPIQKYDGKSD